MRILTVREDLGNGRKELVGWGKGWVGRNLFDNKYRKIWENRYIFEILFELFILYNLIWFYDFILSKIW